MKTSIKQIDIYLPADLMAIIQVNLS